MNNIRFLFSLSLLASVGVLPLTQAVVPPTDGCYPGFTTAEGCLALQNLSTGSGNTGIGWRSLFLVGNGSFNTGVGAGTLALNTADSNTAVGTAALLLNTTGPDNTAIGANTLVHNVAGDSNTAVGAEALEFNNDLASDNTAVGAEALQFNTSGNPNTAVGYAALNGNLTAGGNTAVGYDALLFNDSFGRGFPFGWYNNAVGAGALISNIDGYSNNAFGNDALFFNVTGVANTAVGYYALWNNDSDALGSGNDNTAIGAIALFNNVDGSANTAIGKGAGQNVIAGVNNTYLGDFVGILADDESDTIRIGDVSNGNGAGSLECFIGGIYNNFQPVGGTVVQVTLDLTDDHLGWDYSPSGGGNAPGQRSAPAAPIQQRLLLNEKIGKIGKILPDKKGTPYRVRYEAVNALLLHEVRKEHREVQDLKKQVAALTASLQKVSAQLELNKPAAQTASNNQ